MKLMSPAKSKTPPFVIHSNSIVLVQYAEFAILQHAYNVLFFEAFFRKTRQICVKMLIFDFRIFFGVENLFLVNWIEK